ncbi:MAG: RIO1 family regulatory kinase/ATPase [Steroidobacteraceae bacterium]
MILLKEDLFGRVTRDGDVVIRDAGAARWWLRPLARQLAHRESRALARLQAQAGIPRLRAAADNGVLRRSWIDGSPMQQARPQSALYFRHAMQLTRALHRVGVVHNDLAKEPNWLVTDAGEPALVDFQLSLIRDRPRGRIWRALAYDDIRHLLKHKRSYCPSSLSAREHRILARPSWPARLWKSTGKPLYRFVTRRLLGWSDREGAGDRNHS